MRRVQQFVLLSLAVLLQGGVSHGQRSAAAPDIVGQLDILDVDNFDYYLNRTEKAGDNRWLIKL